MSEPNKHHYLPVFYLTQWAGPDGKLTRYYRAHRDVVASRIAPANTGYEQGLYRLEGYQPEIVNSVEKEYMAKVVDEPASKALKVILEDDYSKMTPKLQIAWTRFVMSLIFRTPQMIDYITKEADRNLRSNLQSDPEDYESVITVIRYFPEGRLYAKDIGPAPIDGATMPRNALEHGSARCRTNDRGS